MEPEHEFSQVLPEIPGILKNEILWVQGYGVDGTLKYAITSTKMRDRYFLYLKENDQMIKKVKADTPAKFQKFIERMT